MKDYPIDKELSILKPIRFRSYSRLRRRLGNAAIFLSMLFYRVPKTISKTKIKLGKVTSYLFTLKNEDQKKPLLIFMHGGGFQMEGTPVHFKMAYEYVHETPYKVLYIKYPLIPKKTFPSALESSYDILTYMMDHQDLYQITSDHLSIFGDSAGGNLAVGMSLLARDLNGPKISKMILIYPVISHRLDTISMKAYDDTPMWNSHLNRSMWELYLKHAPEDKLKYTSFLDTPLHDLPKTYIETAEFDCLRDEGVLFAKQLEQAGVSVEAHHTLGSVHGYDGVFFSDFVKQMKSQRFQFLKEGIQHEKD